jgi:cation-transporting P-type ATPase E
MTGTTNSVVVLQGLSEHEAAARFKQSLGNTMPTGSTRTYFQIIRESLFTFYTNALFLLGIALILLGRWQDAVVAVGVVVMNAVVSVAQEVRAKQTLDRITLLTRPKATVVRDGVEREISPDMVVQGDLLIIQRGDQFVVDGHLEGDGQVEVDESLLTGEADLVSKHAEDPVSSGTFCVTGRMHYRADRVGATSITNRLAAGARAFRRLVTPLQRDVNLLIQILLLIAVFIETLILGNALYESVSAVEIVRRSVVITGIIPVGLFLSITVTYALGAVRLAGRGVLIQQPSAIEALSHVDILCVDKTGTLTSGRLQLDEIVPLAGTRDDLARRLGVFAASATDRNKTGAAIAEAFPASKGNVTSEVPFSSARKWSALAMDDEAAFVLGAPEIVLPAAPEEDQARVQEFVMGFVARGLRVLLFARAPRGADLGSGAQAYQLPAALKPLGVVALRDELRTETRETLAHFAAVGVTIKIISGDHPQTVLALARQAGLAAEAQVVSGVELAGMDAADFAAATANATIFGRITPQQKEQIVHVLRDQGHRVAMTGDGINDVLALKAANVGIAMQSGSPATRAVADVVLLRDSFAPLPRALREGQRIRNGMENIIALFMARTLFVVLLVISVTAITDTFAFTPKTNALLALLAGGIPALALAAWTHPGLTRRRSIFSALLHFTLPAGLMMTGFGLGVFLIIDLALGGAAAAQTALTLFGAACTILLLLFIAPPASFLAGAAPRSQDRRPAWLALWLLVALIGITLLPLTRAFFDLVPLSGAAGGVLALAVLIWAVSTLVIWRGHLFERFLHLDSSSEA